MDKNLSCITTTEGETQFYLSILEDLGWVESVFLIITDTLKTKYEEGEFQKIEVNYFDKEELNNKIYNIFLTFHHFEEPSDYMIAFFIFTVEGTTYVTEPMSFAVKN